MHLYEITYERTVTARELATVTVQAMSIESAMTLGQDEDPDWDVEDMIEGPRATVSIERFTQ